MGTLVFDFLTESFLFDGDLLADRYSRCSEADLRSELRRYRQYCLDHINDLRAEIPSDKTNTTVLAGRGSLSIDHFRRMALYVECHVLNDPLFEMTHESSEGQRVFERSVGSDTITVDRPKLAKVVEFLRALTPMVACNYIKFLPLSLVHEPPQEILLHYSDRYFSDLLPESVMSFFHDRAEVRSLMQADIGWVVRTVLEPCRGISIRFRGQTDNKAAIYHLHEMETLQVDRDSRKVSFALRLPSSPPEPEYFKAWVFQSINRSARDIHDGVLAELALSAECNAMYVAQTPLVFELLQFLGLHQEGIGEHTANALLNVDLPILDGIDTETLMRVRSEEGAAFQSFRDALEKGFSDLRTEKDSEKARLKSENIVHELTELRVRDLDRQIASLKKSVLADAIVIAGGLSGAVHTGGSSLLLAAIAAFRGYKAIEDYQRQVKLNPAYLLWRLQRESR